MPPGVASARSGESVLVLAISDHSEIVNLRLVARKGANVTIERRGRKRRKKRRYAGSAAALPGIALATSYAPARAATRVHPLVALRTDQSSRVAAGVHPCVCALLWLRRIRDSVHSIRG
jgi:hypothetical protein